jgi:Ca2+-transporting ATPase
MSPSGLSATTSITAASPPTPNDQSTFDTKKKRQEGDDDDDPKKPAEIEDVTDPAPFQYRPKELAELAESKSLQDLHNYGGIDAIIKGLGTDKQKGLSAHALGEGGGADGKSGGEGPFGANLEDRKRVYGINQMPVKKSKSLLLLMWLALQDKVLVRKHYQL